MCLPGGRQIEQAGVVDEGEGGRAMGQGDQEVLVSPRIHWQPEPEVAGAPARPFLKALKLVYIVCLLLIGLVLPL